jgi:hypothetical protein
MIEIMIVSSLKKKEEKNTPHFLPNGIELLKIIIGYQKYQSNSFK